MIAKESIIKTSHKLTKCVLIMWYLTEKTLNLYYIIREGRIIPFKKKKENLSWVVNLSAGDKIM